MSRTIKYLRKLGTLTKISGMTDDQVELAWAYSVGKLRSNHYPVVATEDKYTTILIYWALLRLRGKSKDAV